MTYGEKLEKINKQQKELYDLTKSGDLCMLLIAITNFHRHGSNNISGILFNREHNSISLKFKDEWIEFDPDELCRDM